MGIHAAIETKGDAAVAFGRDAGLRFAFRGTEPEFIRIEGLLADRPVAMLFVLERRRFSELVVLCGSKVEPDGPADPVDHCSEMRDEPTFGASPRLAGLPADEIGAVATNFDV
jgi:hypothetical protein